jgi:hypothetical protein
MNTDQIATALFEHEREYLLETLRRNYRVEKGLEERSTGEHSHHGYNARTALRLIELINPRRR